MRVSQTGNNSVQATEVNSAKHGGRVHSAQSRGPDGSAAERIESGGSNEDVKSDISSKARDFSRAKQVAAEAPDVREEKIAELKRRIAAGKYHVDADAVADRMVDEHIKMSGIG